LASPYTPWKKSFLVRNKSSEDIATAAAVAIGAACREALFTALNKSCSVFAYSLLLLLPVPTPLMLLELELKLELEFELELLLVAQLRMAARRMRPRTRVSMDEIKNNATP